jgi:hypothetical protein
MSSNNIDKNKAMIEFLMTCEDIQNNPLFFNFADAEDGHNHFISEKDTTKRSYIDGSMLKQYTFSIANYSTVTHNALVESNDFSDKNIENMAYVQKILDWINEQAEHRNFPDFGPECEIEDMETLTTDPDIDGIDTSVNPPIARYSVGVKVSYLDNSKKIWN